MNRILTVIMGAVLLCAAVPAYAGVGSKQAQYDGGTIAAIPKQMKGKLVTADKDLSFDYQGASYDIPYSSILEMAYGDHPSTRIGTAIGVGLLFWPAGIAALFVHAKHHFLTLEFTEAGKKQAAVFEIGKAVPLTLLPILEAKTGKKVEYQSKNK